MSYQANKSLIGAERSETIHPGSIFLQWYIFHESLGMPSKFIMARPVIKRVSRGWV